MTDPVPAISDTAAAASTTPAVLRTILAIVLLIPGIAGLPAFALCAATFIIQGFAFDVSDHALMPIVLFVSEFCILFSVATVGIVLHYARWRKAPTASLVLAVFSLVIILMGDVMMVSALGIPDAADRSSLIITSGVIVIAISGPPFLHWWNARKRAATPAN